MSLKETLRGQSEHLLRYGFPLQASSLVTHGTKNSPYDHTFWRPFRVNSIPRFLSLATVFLQPLSYVFSSPYISLDQEIGFGLLLKFRSLKACHHFAR